MRPLQRANLYPFYKSIAYYGAFVGMRGHWQRRLFLARVPLQSLDEFQDRKIMPWVFHDVFETLLNGRPTEAVFGGKSRDYTVAQLALHAIQLPGDVRLMNTE